MSVVWKHGGIFDQVLLSFENKDHDTLKGEEKYSFKTRTRTLAAGNYATNAGLSLKFKDLLGIFRVLSWWNVL